MHSAMFWLMSISKHPQPNTNPMNHANRRNDASEGEQYPCAGLDADDDVGDPGCCTTEQQ